MTVADQVATTSHRPCVLCDRLEPVCQREQPFGGICGHNEQRHRSNRSLIGHDYVAPAATESEKAPESIRAFEPHSVSLAPGQSFDVTTPLGRVNVTVSGYTISGRAYVTIDFGHGQPVGTRAETVSGTQVRLVR